MIGVAVVPVNVHAYGACPVCCGGHIPFNIDIHALRLTGVAVFSPEAVLGPGKFAAIGVLQGHEPDLAFFKTVCHGRVAPGSPFYNAFHQEHGDFRSYRLPGMGAGYKESGRLSARIALGSSGGLHSPDFSSFGSLTPRFHSAEIGILLRQGLHVINELVVRVIGVRLRHGPGFEKIFILGHDRLLVDSALGRIPEDVLFFQVIPELPVVDEAVFRVDVNLGGTILPALVDIYCIVAIYELETLGLWGPASY